MKYDRNIFEYNVSESFDFDFDFIKPIIEKEWKYYIEIGFTSIDEVIAAYKELDLNVCDSVEYDYINADALPMINSILLKENVSKVAVTERVNRKKVINYYMVNQYLVRHTYFQCEAVKVLEYLFFKKYPYFDDYPFIEYKPFKGLKKLNVSNLKSLKYGTLDLPTFLEMLESNEDLDKIKNEIKSLKIKKVNKIEIYFSMFGPTLYSS